MSNTRNFILHKLGGNVRNWYETLPESDKRILENGIVNGTSETGLHVIQKFKDAIYHSFVGLDALTQKDRVAKQQVEKAKWHLDNMIICDMCYFPEFACEYEKYYHQLDDTSKKHYIDVFLNKLPSVIHDKAAKNWKERPPEISESLAGLIRTVNSIVTKICITRALVNTTEHQKNRICCDSSSYEIPGRYGCSKPSSSMKSKRHKKYYKKYYRKKYGFKRKPKKYFNKYKNKRTFFKKKRSFRQSKDPCPKGKGPNCRCWLCNETGHYANNCPNRTNQKVNSEKIKMLELAYSFKLEPVEESDLSDTESIYEIETDLDPDSNESSSEDESD